MSTSALPESLHYYNPIKPARRATTLSKGSTMTLQIFDTDSAEKSVSFDFSNDVVGRFRSGYQIDGRPQALGAWRVTTGDPEVASSIQKALGGDKPQEWAAMGEDNLEVFTAATTIKVILDDEKAIRQSMVLRDRNGQIVRAGDGAVLHYPEDLAGTADPEADSSFQERKTAARAGMGAQPEVDVFFKLADNPDLGKFRFRTGSWSFVSDLNYNSTIAAIETAAEPATGVYAEMGLEEVSFTAKSGPRKGSKVTFTKPTLKVLGTV